MKNYKNYDMEEVSFKYIMAKLEKSTIIEQSIIGFLCGVGLMVIFLIMWIRTGTTKLFDESFWTWMFLSFIFGMYTCGFPYVCRKVPNILGFIGACLIGTPVTLGALCFSIITIKKCDPIIEEDKKNNTELYMEVEETVQLLIDMKPDISKKYVTDEVLKYRNLLFEKQITRDEYVKFVRRIVDSDI